ncbi:MAG: hypothetical protein ACXVXE_15665 [Nocardioidaceae bacterium]
MLCVLLPVIEAEGDPATRVWWLVLLAPVFALLFAGWERWVVRPACR